MPCRALGLQRARARALERHGPRRGRAAADITGIKPGLGPSALRGSYSGPPPRAKPRGLYVHLLHLMPCRALGLQRARARALERHGPRRGRAAADITGIIDHRDVQFVVDGGRLGGDGARIQFQASRGVEGLATRIVRLHVHVLPEAGEPAQGYGHVDDEDEKTDGGD